MAPMLVGAVVTVVTESERVLLFLAAGMLVWLVGGPSNKWLAAAERTASVLRGGVSRWQ